MRLNTTFLLAVIFIVGGYILYLRDQNKKLKSSEEMAYNNLRAEVASSDTLKSQSKLYRMTISDLEDRVDSMSVGLVKAKDRLRVKDRDLRMLASIHSSFSSKDTVVVKDTIFVKGLPIDTIVGDEWYSMLLSMRYPDTLRTNLNVRSQKDVVVHARRFIRKPSKIFFIRWFQKKSTEIIVDIKDQNPHINEDGSRFIEIVD